MTFSNVNVFNSSFKAISASTPAKSDSAVLKGGAFSPNALETISIMRASFDEQWENAYIIKYQALMQNRLNSLKQKLQGAYNNLVQQSTSQQIRENGSTNEISATTDVYGRMLPGTQTGVSGDVNQAFKGLQYYGDITALNAADGKGQFDQNVGSGTDLDGIPSYYMQGETYKVNDAGVKTTEQKVYEMRKLYNSGAAMQISNTMKVTFRSEEVPPKALEPSIFSIISKSDNPSNKPGEKISEGSTEVKTGGFWSTVNYLYNFAPRELKYSYATSYSTTTEEAGTRNVGDEQATLFSRKIIDGRDSQNTTSGDLHNDEDYSIGALDSNGNVSDGNYPKYGSRIKWATSNPEDGYTTERNVLANMASGGTDDDFINSDAIVGEGADNESKYIDNRLIVRRTVDNEASFSNFDENFNSFADIVKGNPGVAANGGGNKPADPWTGWEQPPSLDNQPENKVKIYGSEEGGITGINDRIVWEYQHDGIGAYDRDRDGRINRSDTHEATAAFVNHYQVTLQTVELNTNPDSYGKVLALGHTRKNSTSVLDNPYEFVDADSNNLDDETGQSAASIDKLNLVATQLLRSGGIDASADHVFSDTDPVQLDALGRKIMTRVDVQPDGSDSEKNEKLLLAGSGKLAKNFTAKQVEGFHEINSYNGQSLGAHGGNIQISAENANSEPMILAEYEGFKRAQMMSIGLAHDTYNDYGQQSRTLDAAIALKDKLEAEVNASSMVDTDWHYSEYNDAATAGTLDGIMFRNIKQITYNDPDKGAGVLDIFYDSKKRDDPNGNTFQFVDPKTGQATSVQGGTDDTFDDVNVGFRKTFTLERKDFQTLTYEAKQEPFYVNTPRYDPRNVIINVGTQNANTATMNLIVNGNIVSPFAAGQYNIGSFLQEGDNVIAAQILFDDNLAPRDGAGDFFSVKADPGNDKDITNWISSKISTVRSKTGDDKSTELTTATNAGTMLSGWQSKIMTNLITPALYAGIYPVVLPAEPVFAHVEPSTGLTVPAATGTSTPMSERAYNEYINALRGLGSTQTATKVKDSNVFAKILIDAMNSKEYRDVFTLGLWNSNLGKDISLQVQVASPSGGNVQSTVRIKYNPVNAMFSILQTKWDASAAPQQS